MVAAENEGQCFRLNVLYDWGATVSMISEEAVEVMGLAITKQAKRIIKGLGGMTTVSKGTESGGSQRRQEDGDDLGGRRDSIVTRWRTPGGRR
jgi:hypothetical protein